MIKKILLAGLMFVSGSVHAFSEADYAKYSASRGAKYEDVYDTASKKHRVTKSILMRMGAIESGYWNPSIINGSKKSHKHAIGIAQFVPRTARLLGVDPYDVQSSINGQAKYMRMLYDNFGSWYYAACAYNWGEGNVRKVLRGKRSMPKSVKRYGMHVTKGE